MEILGCQVSSQEVKVLGDYCFYKTTQKTAKEILFNYFLEVYGIEEVLDSRLMFYDDYDGDNYEEIFEKDFDLWLGIMENYFISNFIFLYRNWDQCKKVFIETYDELLN